MDLQTEVSPMHNNTTVTLATGCMNRTDSLKWSLPSWLERPEIDEIVIVDWSSTAPVNKALSTFDDPRIRFVRVEGQQHWCAARCHNVEILAARSEALLRIDSDVRLMPEFFQRHPLDSSKIFWNLAWQQCTCDEDRHLAGTVYSMRENFLLVKGYNEYMRAYGYEDDDIYLRLVDAGIAHRHADRNQLQHLPHSNESRLSQITPAFLNGDSVERTIGYNCHLSKVHPWSARDEYMSQWDMVRVNDRLSICRLLKQGGTSHATNV